MRRPRKTKPVVGEKVAVTITEPVITEEDGTPASTKSGGLTRRQRECHVKLLKEKVLAAEVNVLITKRDVLLWDCVAAHKKLGMAEKLFEVRDRRMKDKKGAQRFWTDAQRLRKGWQKWDDLEDARRRFYHALYMAAEAKNDVNEAILKLMSAKIRRHGKLCVEAVFGGFTTIDLGV